MFISFVTEQETAGRMNLAAENLSAQRRNVRGKWRRNLTKITENER
jgi:hypothetical protein